MSQLMRVCFCQRCAGKIGQAYSLFQVQPGGACSICGQPGSAYDMRQKQQKKQRTKVSAGFQAEREQRVKRRSWA